MATTVALQGRLADITSQPIEEVTKVTVKAPVATPGVEITTSQPVPVEVAPDGTFTLNVVDGVGWLYLEGNGWSDSIRFVAAAGMTKFWEAVVNALPIILEAKRLLWELGAKYDSYRSELSSDYKKYLGELLGTAVKSKAELLAIIKTFEGENTRLLAEVQGLVDQLNEAFASSAAGQALPPRLTEAALDKRYLQEGERLTHVKSFGAVGDGAADDTAALTAAIDSGVPLYWGGPEDVYSTTSMILKRLTSDAYWVSNGAKVKCDATSPIDRVFQIECDGSNFSIQGRFTIDAQMNAFTCLTIINGVDTLSECTLQDVTVENAYRASKTFRNGDGIGIRGGFRTVTIDRPVVRNIIMAPEGSDPGFNGVTGINITSLTAQRSPRDVVITAPYIEKVWAEDTASNVDQDGIKIFAAEDVAGVNTPHETKFSIVGGTIKECGGRAIKSQAEWGIVDGVKIHRSLDRVQGGADIDFQVGGGIVRNVVYQYENNTGSTCVNFSGPETAGKLIPHGTVSGLRVLVKGNKAPQAIVTFNQRNGTRSSVVIDDVEVVGFQPPYVLEMNGVSDGLHHAVLSNIFSAPTSGLVRGGFGSPNGWKGSISVSNAVNTEGATVPIFVSTSGTLAAPRVRISNSHGFSHVNNVAIGDKSSVVVLGTATDSSQNISLVRGSGVVSGNAQFYPGAGTWRFTYFASAPFQRRFSNTGIATITPSAGSFTEVVTLAANHYVTFPAGVPAGVSFEAVKVG